MGPDRDSLSPKLGSRERDPSVVSSGGPTTPQHVIHGLQRVAGGGSWEEAIYIPSDDESDIGDDDDVSDIDLPPIEELWYRRKDGTVAGIGMYLILPGRLLR
jgi:hypothetical protein